MKSGIPLPSMSDFRQLDVKTLIIPSPPGMDEDDYEGALITEADGTYDDMAWEDEGVAKSAAESAFDLLQGEWEPVGMRFRRSASKFLAFYRKTK